MLKSILGTTFTGEAVEVTEFGGHTAVVPQVTGSASVVGRNEWWIDPEEVVGRGFMLR